MEAVLNNLTGAAELLAVARTDAVRRWDARALHRAFQWTRYCQRVHSRFRDKRAIRAAMERRLRAANDGLRAAAYFPGHADVTFADLSRCERALLAALLGNPALPRAALGSLLLVAGSSPDVGTGENGDGDAAGHCAQLIACKSACEVLRAARAKTAAFPGGDAEVQGVMLMETLDALRGEGGRGGEHAAQELLESMLQKSEEEDNVVLVIASALRRKSSATAGGASRGFLLNWLLQNDQMLQKICSRLPAEDMMSQVKDSEDFRAAYCDVLRRWVLRYDL
ncbi:Fanconi anemia group F protein [Merluccius polli]|uniref:Fanconi anemia group F protein n=1 Tax=Merluccius polli TaxID=89951 RepID=A0AA47NZZ8_MERPO|nr:Fanconi anemia group F protein [Merluccius polli]